MICCVICGEDANTDIPVMIPKVGIVLFCSDCLNQVSGAVSKALWDWYSESKS